MLLSQVLPIWFSRLELSFIYGQEIIIEMHKQHINLFLFALWALRQPLFILTRSFIHSRSHIHSYKIEIKQNNYERI